MSRIHFLTHLLNHPDAFSIAVLASLAVIGLAALYLMSKLEPTVLMVVAIVLEMFSGNWKLANIPLPLDRVALILALGALVIKGPRYASERKLVVRPLHLALLSAAAWCAASGLVAGTITGHLGFYAFLDRFGLVPFVMFTTAPLFFGTPRQRRILLVGLSAMAFYLGFTGVMEGLHVYRLVVPSYIADPNNGIQFGRARGPILESTGDGFCVIVGAVACAIGLTTWRSSRVRAFLVLTIGLDIATLFFTLTRSVWIAGFLGAVVGMLLHPRTRRVLLPTLAAGIVAVGALLAVSPSIRNHVIGRTEAQSPVWDRQNTDLAALKIVSEHPIFGVGWENFVNVSPQYMVQQKGYPISGLGIEVHNVFLSHAAELGIPGLILWLLAIAGAARRGLLPWRVRDLWRLRLQPGRAPPRLHPDADADLDIWRLGLLTVGLAFGVIADLAPFSQALPNTLLWLFLGIVSSPYTSRLRPGHARAALRLAGAGGGSALLPVPARPATAGPGGYNPVYL